MTHVLVHVHCYLCTCTLFITYNTEYILYEYKYQQKLSALHAMWDRSSIASIASIAHFSFLDRKLEATWAGYYVTTCPLPCGPHGSILLHCTSILLSSHLSLLSTLIGVYIVICYISSLTCASFRTLTMQPAFQNGSRRSACVASN